MSRIVSCLRPRCIASLRPGRITSGSVAAVSSFALLILGLLLSSFTQAAAQSAGEFQRTYINPFPGGDRYRIVVLGDSLGDGLWSGLYRAFEDDTNLEFVKALEGLDRLRAHG